MLGWIATRTRCVRPRGAASSWYRLTRDVTSAPSSAAKAARSAALANRISASRANVDRGRRSRVAPVRQGADVADEPGGERQQPNGRALIGRAARVGLEGGQRSRRDHVRARARAHDPLRDVALAPLRLELDQPVPLERPEVVIDELPRQADPASQHRRGRRLSQGLQESRPHRVEQRLGRGGVLDDRDVKHGRHRVTDKKSCQAKNHRRRRHPDGPPKTAMRRRSAWDRNTARARHERLASPPQAVVHLPSAPPAPDCQTEPPRGSAMRR